MLFWLKGEPPSWMVDMTLPFLSIIRLLKQYLELVQAQRYPRFWKLNQIYSFSRDWVKIWWFNHTSTVTIHRCVHRTCACEDCEPGELRVFTHNNVRHSMPHSWKVQPYIIIVCLSTFKVYIERQHRIHAFQCVWNPGQRTLYSMPYTRAPCLEGILTSI